MKRLPASFSIEAIRGAWAESRDSTPSTQGAPGVDRVVASVFASNLREHILELRENVRVGAFRFSKLRIAPIPKPSGGHRIIAIPTVRDRLVQRCLLRDLDSAPRFTATSSISFGFSKGKTLADAQRTALSLRQDHPWMLQADIVKFFDRIQRADIKALVRRRVRKKVIAELLCAAIDCELEDRGGSGAEIARDNGIRKGLGLRQGMPVSPMLSNLLLKAFDEALSRRGIVAIRYADDIAIFGSSRNECSDALKFVQESLSRLRLDIPDLDAGGKTVLLEPSASAEFLGVEIKRFPEGYRLRAPNGKLAKIDADMTERTSLNCCVEKKKNIGQIVRDLDAFIIGHRASMMVLDDADDFFNRLEAQKRKHLRALLIQVVGKAAVDRLDVVGLSILGLAPFPV